MYPSHTSPEFCELSPATHSFLLLTDNVPGLNEAGHVVTFQHLRWPQLGCLILGNCLTIGSFALPGIPQISIWKHGHKDMSFLQSWPRNLEDSVTNPD